MSEPQKQFLTYQEVAGRLDVSLMTVRKWAQRKQFEVVKIGRVVRVKSSEIDAFLERHTRIAVKGR